MLRLIKDHLSFPKHIKLSYFLPIIQALNKHLCSSYHASSSFISFMSSSKRPYKAACWRREERQDSPPPPQGSIWSWLQCHSYPREDVSPWLSGMSLLPSALQSLHESDQIRPCMTLCSPCCLTPCLTGCRRSTRRNRPELLIHLCNSPFSYPLSTQEEMHADGCK